MTHRASRGEGERAWRAHARASSTSRAPSRSSASPPNQPRRRFPCTRATTPAKNRRFSPPRRCVAQSSITPPRARRCGARFTTCLWWDARGTRNRTSRGARSRPRARRARNPRWNTRKHSWHHHRTRVTRMRDPDARSPRSWRGPRRTRRAREWRDGTSRGKDTRTCRSW